MRRGVVDLIVLSIALVVVVAMATAALGQTFPARDLEEWAAAIEADINDLRDRVDALEGDPDDPDPVPPPRAPQIQAGPWFISAASPKFINHIRGGRGNWSDDGAWSNKRLFDEGFIDPATGLPNALPDNRRLRTELYLHTLPIGEIAGEWAITWDTTEGPERAAATVIGASNIVSRETGRVVFSIAEGQYAGFVRVELARIDAPLTALSLHRVDDEDDLVAGKLLRPTFRATLARYDIYRSMDFDRAAQGDIRTAGEVSPCDKTPWGDLALPLASREGRAPTRAIPHCGAVAVAMETNTALWRTVPLTLGAPPTLDIAGMRGNADEPNIGPALAAEIIASPQWDRWAADFVAALDAGGYPKDRPLYFTVGNEVWNFANPFGRTTNYAGELGLNIEGNGWAVRRAYGVLVARAAVAMRDALAAAGREDQKITYVAESWTAGGGSTTRDALREAREWLEANGEDWAEWSPRFGVSFSTYWGNDNFWPEFLGGADNLAARFLARLEARGREGLGQDLRDYFLTTNLPGVFALMAQHVDYASAEGVAVIGAYEGGPHILPRRDWMTIDALEFIYWFQHVSPYGAEVNAAMMAGARALVPGFIPSDYSLNNALTEDDPWHNGVIGSQSAIMSSYTEYLRE